MSGTFAFHNIYTTKNEVENIQTVLHEGNESGEGTMRRFEVAPGIQITYNDLKMDSCFRPIRFEKDFLQINHCLEGCYECELEGGSVSFLGEGDLCVDYLSKDRQVFLGSRIPLKKYRGITVLLEMETAQQTLDQGFQQAHISLEQIKERLCSDGRSLIIKSKHEIDHIFSELYSVDERIQVPYFWIKVIELLLFLSLLDGSAVCRPQQFSADISKRTQEVYQYIIENPFTKDTIQDNPTIYLTTKGGGVPQEDRQALTDEQAARLLDAIRDLPPYVFVMIGLYAGLRREEILALQWDSVYLDTDTPYLTVRRAWHTEHNRPVISDELKTKAAERNIPLPVCLAECLKAAKETSTSEYVVSNRDGEPLSYTQFKRLWQYIVTRTVKERSYYRYEDGKRVKHTVTPVLGEKAAHNGKVVYSLDFEVTPHQLRHTYITNLIHASVDPKTVQYLAGHESSKITMDIYAKVKYNRPDELVRSMSCAFASWDAAQ